MSFSPSNLLVKDLCTDSISLISPLLYGLQTIEPYSTTGITSDLNSVISGAGSLVIKVRSISPDTPRALADFKLIWSEKSPLLLKSTPRSLTVDFSGKFSPSGVLYD